jgi:hypothetical protein
MTYHNIQIESMEHVWKYYNTLPTLFDANARFVNRDLVFAELVKLLAKYDNTFGVSLVHTHCILAEGEIMLEDDDISEPVGVSKIKACYAHCWLPSGQPYEFTTHPTPSPPDALISEFRTLTESVGVLGLYYAGDDDETKLEWTEGRKNMLRTIQKEDWNEDPMETAWNLGKGEPVTMACRKVCATATTAEGGAHLSEFPT